MRIPDHIVEQVRTQANIVDVIGEHVRLRKAGRNYLGLCPFHTEKTPSFNVNLERGIYKCFGCGRAGNAIGFVQEFHHMGFADAVRHLAQKMGIVIPDETAEDPTGLGPRRDAARAALREAADYYAEVLATPEGAIARTMFERRGFLPETLTTWKLGASPSAWDSLSQHLTSHGYTTEQLNDAGLIVVREDGRFYDRFRGRAMFPIRDDQGRVVGFSARSLTTDPASPKYVNSPQGLVFDKSRVLYGLDLAKRSIAEIRTAIVVEGQADVVAMHQAGFRTTVASSGTALTEDHVRLLKKYADTIIVVYDADSAGQTATSRAIEVALAGGLDVRCVSLPAGTDPDSLIRSEGRTAMETLVQHAKGWLTWRTEKFLAEGVSNDSVRQAAAVRTMLEWISRIPDTLRRPFYVRELATVFGLPDGLLLDQLLSMGQADRTSSSRPVQPPQRSTSSPSSAPPTGVPTPSAVPQQLSHHQQTQQQQSPHVPLAPERELLRVALFVTDGLAMLLHEFHVDDETFVTEAGQRLFRRILIADAEHHDILQHVLNDEQLHARERQYVADLAFAAVTPSVSWERFNVDMPAANHARPVRDALISLEIIRLSQQVDVLSRTLDDVKDVDAKLRLVNDVRQLLQHRDELLKKRSDMSDDTPWQPGATPSPSLPSA